MSEQNKENLGAAIERLQQLAEQMREPELERQQMLELLEQCADAATEAADALDRAARASAREAIPGQEELL